MKIKSQLKKALATLLVAVPMMVSAQITIDETNFPDEKFRAYLLAQDYGADGVITEEEIEKVTDIYVGWSNISSLKGIEYFTALTSLTCYFNRLTSLDVSENTKLTTLNCADNQLTSLDVSQNTNLTSLSCYSNPLTSLDVSQNTNLTSLYCFSNQLTSLDVSQNTNLTNLSCSSNQLTSLDVSKNTELEYLSCSSNQLTSLDVSQNTNLTYLYCDSNQLTSLDVSQNTNLTYLYCSSNQLTSLDVSQNTNLTFLASFSNPLTSLDVSQNTNLTYLYCFSNQLTSLDVSQNTNLTYLACSSNQLTSLDVSQNTNLLELYCFSNPLTSLDVSQNTNLTSLSCDSNQLTSLDVSQNINLTTLLCSSNPLTSLDVSKNTELEYLACSSNQLTSLDVSQNTNLTFLNCSRNQIQNKEMDAFIESLPQKIATDMYSLYIYDNTVGDEGNICTKSQVEMAKARGWTPYYRFDVSGWDWLDWLEYEGSDEPTSISVSLSSKTIEVGESFTLTYTILPSDATTTVTWSSDDSSIASVDENTGEVIGIKAGTTYITATTDNGLSDKCQVTVEWPQPSEISVSPTSKTIEVGESFTLTYTILPSDATTTVTWSSDDSSIASVDENTGEVTGIKAGTTYIMVTTDNGLSDKCQVTVEWPKPSDISVSPSSKTIEVGESFTLTYTLTPSNAETTLTWTSDDETIATVNSEGVVTGLQKGQTFINVETENGKKAYCELTVTAPEPTDIALPNTATLYVGETLTLTPTLAPEGVETTLTWKSDDESVVQVDADGMLTGVSEGLALVTVSTANGLTSNACKVKVELDPSSSISDILTDEHTDVPIYTISGQRLAAPKKGFNIIGGKKVFIK